MTASGVKPAGARPPLVRTTPPGPRSRAASEELRRLEAPGINTLAGDAPNVLWRTALGANVTDLDGNRYLDLTAGFGVAAVGHRHPDVVAAIRRQSGALIHGLGDAMAHPGRIALAAALVARAPVDDAQVYFAISGGDAVEVAIKSAVLATGKAGVLAFEPSYHGLTLGALAATSRPAFRDPFAAHLHDRVVRLPFACPPERVARALAGGEIACVLVEPIVGREGVLIPADGWLPALAETCREAGALLAVDEIFTGFGRTGTFFAVDREGVRPDLLCCGKALGGGLPIGAVVGRREILAAWSAPGEARHTATFVANPLACAAALAVLETLERDQLPARAAALGARFAPRLLAWPERFAAVRAVRGRGLLWGVELGDAGDAARLVEGARARGVLLLAGGPHGRVAQLVPPLTIDEGLLAQALERLEETLDFVSL